MTINKDSIPFGILIGLVVPFVSYAILLQLNDWIIAAQFDLPNGGYFEGFSLNLLAIMALCCNLIPFRFFVRKKMDDSMRGMIFPTLVYGFIWAIYFNKIPF